MSDLLSREPTEKEVEDACMAYRHDYGLLEPHQQETWRLMAIDWLDSWKKAVRQGGTP